MKKPRKGRAFLVLFIILALVGIAVAAYFVYNYYNNRGNTLNNKKVFEAAQKSFNEFPGVSKLIPTDRDKLKKEIEPQYLAGYVTGFGPNENEIKQAKATIGDQANYESIKAYIERIINGKLALAKSAGYYQGYVYNYWYGNTIINKFPNEEIKDWGNNSVLESDKQYAKSKAENDRTRLKENKISPKALSIENNADARLALRDQDNGSGYFQTSLSDGTDLFSKLGFKEPNPGQSESFNDLLKSVSKLGVTDIGNIVADPGEPKSGKKREVGYVMAYIELLLKGESSIKFYEQQLKIAGGKLK
jgi:hypothetical protein